MKINHTSLPNSHLQGRRRHKIFHKKLHETFMPTEKRNAESLSFKEENTYLQTNVEAAADAESNLSLCVNLRQKKVEKKKKFHNNATFSNAFSHTTLKSENVAMNTFLCVKITRLISLLFPLGL